MQLRLDEQQTVQYLTMQAIEEDCIINAKEKIEYPKQKKIDPKYVGKKMSRNEPCLCGSGKKYKRCCGAL